MQEKREKKRQARRARPPLNSKKRIITEGKQPTPQVKMQKNAENARALALVLAV